MTATDETATSAAPVPGSRAASSRDTDALRSAIERLGGRLDTTRDMLDRLAARAADAQDAERAATDVRPTVPVARAPQPATSAAAPTAAAVVARPVAPVLGADLPGDLLAHVVLPTPPAAGRG